MATTYSVWAIANKGEEMQPLDTCEDVNEAIELAEKAFDEKGYHQTAVIDNRSMAAVFAVHA